MLSRKYAILTRLFTMGKYKTLTSYDVSFSKFYSVKKEIQTMREETFESHGDKPGLGTKIARLEYSDSILSKIMLQVKSKRTRKKSNLIFFEGKRLLSDALDAGIKPLYIFFSKKDDIQSFKLPEETKLMKVPYNDLKIWSDLTTCPGIIAVCKTPDVVTDYEPSIPVSIICDNVREPGNLGSIIRNTAAAGVKSVYLSEGCIDLWNSKVLRGGMGAHFRVPVYNEVTWEEMQKSIPKETLLLIATNENVESSDSEILPYYEIGYTNHKNITLVIGGETEGISKNAYNLVKLFSFKKITIPLCNGIESLNNVSALSVILYEIKRQFETTRNEKI